jgi:hypothetical protein
MFRKASPRFVDVAATSIADKNGSSPRASGLGLEYRFLTFLVAVCTYSMRWFSLLHSRLQRVSNSVGMWRFLQLIALLLCLPCFHIGNLFFEATYFLQQRRLRYLGRQCVLKGGEDLSLKFTDLPLRYHSVSDAKKTLCRVVGAFDRGEGSSNSGNFSHLVFSPSGPTPPAGYRR